MKTAPHQPIHPEMLLLDMLSLYPGTEPIIKSYDTRVGECICCEMLFNEIREICDRYHLDLNTLLGRLNKVAGSGV